MLGGKQFLRAAVHSDLAFADALVAVLLNAVHHGVELTSASFSRAVAQLRHDTRRDHELTIGKSSGALVSNRCRDGIRHTITGATQQSATIGVVA